MKCHTLLLVVNLWVVGGSLVELIDSMDAVPPLFEVQDWSRCQRPGDVYCVLEAALVGGNQTTMQLLQEYSAQTLKHFNRSLVHRGVCATRCAGAAGAGGAVGVRAQACVNESLRAYGFEAQFSNLRSLCVSPSTPRGGGGAPALAALVVMLVVLAILATAAHVLAPRFGKKCSKFVLAFSLRRNWDILTYDRSKPRSDQRMKGLACLEGFRVLGIQCVIFVHVLLVTGNSFIANPQFFEHMYETFIGQALLNLGVWLQIFFCLSGFFSSFYALIFVESSPFTPLTAVMAVAIRWIRLSPTAGIVMWFVASWLPQLGSGPLWGWYVDSEAEACGERWWYHLLYVQNHLPKNKWCILPTWHIAVDMQLSVLGMLLLLVLLRCQRVALPTLLVLLAGSAVAAGIATYWYQLTPLITGLSPENLRTMFSNAKLVPNLYMPMWMNLPGYVCGMGAGFVFYDVLNRGIKLRENKWFNLVFHLSLPLGTCVTINGVWFLRDAPPPHWLAVLYASLDRSLIALCFAVFMLGCVTNCKSFLRSMLAWRGFHPLGRLSYCVFLVHFFVLRVLITNSPQLFSLTALSLLSLFITASVLSYVIAVPLCLLVELPTIELFKAGIKWIKRSQ